MKRWIAGVISLVLICATAPAAWCEESISVSAQSAVVIDALTGSILYQKNAHQKRSVASTTKIMTTLLALEQGDLNQEIVTTKEMVTVEGSGMGLLPGDSVSLEELCYGMMLSSGNDAANTVATVIAGSLAHFADRMNQKAVLLNLNNTHFVTPSGLDAQHHYSTAYDMALLTRYALQNPTFCKMAAAQRTKVTYGNPPYRRTLTNHNRLLKEYEGCIGVKTGFTKKAGRCLVSAATREGATVICVTLSAPDDWNDHKRLLDYGFNKVEKVSFQTETRWLPVVGATTDRVQLSHQSLDIWLPSYKKGICSVQWQISPFLYAPVPAGKTMGTFSVLLEGTPIASTPIVAQETAVLVSVPGFFKRWKQNLARMLKN